MCGRWRLLIEVYPRSSAALKLNGTGGEDPTSQPFALALLYVFGEMDAIAEQVVAAVGGKRGQVDNRNAGSIHDLISDHVVGIHVFFETGGKFRIGVRRR